MGPYTGPWQILNNFYVPAGVTCRVPNIEVFGNATIDGNLISAGIKFDRNVTVTGTINLANSSTVLGNFAITGSSGDSSLGCTEGVNKHTFGGNFAFTGNSGLLYVCNATPVAGSVNISNNTRINDGQGPWVADVSGISAKSFTCGGNVAAYDGPAIKTSGGGNTSTTPNSCPDLNIAIVPAAPAAH
jgi:hypothetical protein